MIFLNGKIVSSLLALSSGDGGSPGLQGSPGTDGIGVDPDENKAHRQRLEPRVFKDLFDLKENRESLQTMA